MTEDVPVGSTLTSRVAAIQIKLWHLYFRMKKIRDDQKRLHIKKFKSPRTRLVRMAPAVYNCIDMIISMEHLSTAMADVRATSEQREHFVEAQLKQIGVAQNVSSKWIAVRNKLGGHLDITVFEEMCERHGISGVLISQNPEADAAIYNMLLLESAINSTRKKSQIFDRELDCRNNLSQELKAISDKISEDWNAIFETFAPIIEAIYEIGKRDKLLVASSEELAGMLKSQV